MESADISPYSSYTASENTVSFSHREARLPSAAVDTRLGKILKNSFRMVGQTTSAAGRNQ